MIKITCSCCCGHMHVHLYEWTRLRRVSNKATALTRSYLCCLLSAASTKFRENQSGGFFSAEFKKKMFFFPFNKRDKITQRRFKSGVSRLARLRSAALTWRHDMFLYLNPVTMPTSFNLAVLALPPSLFHVSLRLFAHRSPRRRSDERFYLAAHLFTQSRVSPIIISPYSPFSAYRPHSSERWNYRRFSWVPPHLPD